MPRLGEGWPGGGQGGVGVLGSKWCLFNLDFSHELFQPRRKDALSKGSRRERWPPLSEWQVLKNLHAAVELLRRAKARRAPRMAQEKLQRGCLSALLPGGSASL